MTHHTLGLIRHGAISRLAGTAGLLLLTVAVAGAFELTLEGWEPVGEPVQYGADTLWEYINGAADQYLAYGFQELTHSEWKRNDTIIIVDAYELGTPLQAFGLFLAQAPAPDQRVAIGAGAALSLPYQALLAKGRMYVRVEFYEGPVGREQGLEVLTLLERALPGTSTQPADFRRLPAAGRVPGSEGYARESYLGLRELRDLVHATYTAEWGEYVVFSLLAEDEAERQVVWNRIAAKWRASDNSPAFLYREVPYQGFVGVIQTPEGLMGAGQCPDASRLAARLRALTE